MISVRRLNEMLSGDPYSCHTILNNVQEWDAFFEGNIPCEDVIFPCFPLLEDLDNGSGLLEKFRNTGLNPIQTTTYQNGAALRKVRVYRVMNETAYIDFVTLIRLHFERLHVHNYVVRSADDWVARFGDAPEPVSFKLPVVALAPGVSVEQERRYSYLRASGYQPWYTVVHDSEPIHIFRLDDSVRVLLENNDDIGFSNHPDAHGYRMLCGEVHPGHRCMVLGSGMVDMGDGGHMLIAGILGRNPDAILGDPTGGVQLLYDVDAPHPIREVPDVVRIIAQRRLRLDDDYTILSPEDYDDLGKSDGPGNSLDKCEVLRWRTNPQKRRAVLLSPRECHYPAWLGFDFDTVYRVVHGQEPGADVTTHCVNLI